MLSFGISSVFGGVDPAGFKLGNILLHVCIACSILILSGQIARVAFTNWDQKHRDLFAILVASIWLFHPLHVSTVLYAVQRMAQLSTLLVVVGVSVYLSFRQRWEQSTPETGEVLALGLWLLLLFLLAVYSKENGAILPLIIAVFEVSLFTRKNNTGYRRGINFVAMAVLLLAFTCLVSIVIWPPEFIAKGYSHRSFSLPERLLTESRVLWHYVGWTFFPYLDAMGFQHDDIIVSKSISNPISTLLALVCWLIVIVITTLLRSKFRILFLGTMFFLTGHLIESSVLALELIYEHRNYLPSIGICLLIAAALVSLFSRVSGIVWSVMLVGIFLTLILQLGLRSYYWSDELMMSSSNVTSHPDSPRANFLYASDLLEVASSDNPVRNLRKSQSELLNESLKHFEKMYELDSNSITALTSLYGVKVQYFPSMLGHNDYPGRLLSIADSGPLSSSDYSAVSGFIDCLIAKKCHMDESIMRQFLDSLHSRSPKSTIILGQQYRYYGYLGDSSKRLDEIRLKALSIDPTDRYFAFNYIAGLPDHGDIAGVYEVIRQWLLADPERRDLLFIKSLFVESDSY